MNEIKNYIVHYIEQNGNLPPDLAADDFNFLTSGYIDSLSLFEFIVNLEEKFDINFSDEEISAPEFETVGGLTQMIQRKLGDRNDG